MRQLLILFFFFLETNAHTRERERDSNTKAKKAYQTQNSYIYRFLDKKYGVGIESWSQKHFTKLINYLI